MKSNTGLDRERVRSQCWDHLESVLYLLSEVMNVTVLDGCSLRLSSLCEVDSLVSLILTDTRALGWWSRQAGAGAGASKPEILRLIQLSLASPTLQLYLVSLTVTANKCSVLTLYIKVTLGNFIPLHWLPGPAGGGRQGSTDSGDWCCFLIRTVQLTDAVPGRDWAGRRRRSNVGRSSSRASSGGRGTSSIHPVQVRHDGLLLYWLDINRLLLYEFVWVADTGEGCPG